MNNNPSKTEWMEVELELLKDRVYNTEEYIKHLKDAFIQWSEAITKKLQTTEQEVTDLTVNEIMTKCQKEGKTLEIRQGKAYIK